MDADELGFTTRIRVDLRRKLVVIAAV